MFHMRAATVLLCSAIASLANAQIAPATYWVQFRDKENTPFSITEPSAFLSQRSIDRRTAQGIPVDEMDLPVDPAYISALLAAGQFQLHTTSKWFNAVTIRSTDTLALDTIALLPFVAEMRNMDPNKPGSRRAPEKMPTIEPLGKSSFYNGIYGASFRQIAMMNGHLLHTLANARGEGMLIGVLDGGFDAADSLDAFAELRARNGIRATLDVVCQHCDVFQEHWHGRSVLSMMAGELPGEMLGSAPHADYVLMRTEDVYTEYPVEEENWIRGAEFADSIGCDVLNTSLGYTQFDDSTMDHTYADLDGATIRISIAAGIASRKGMIPVQSAGNSGFSSWRYISAAADAIDILSVGAVDMNRQVAGFSSRGPSADGRVKPDVSAVGSGAIGLGIDGLRVEGISGTSFSSPLTCGLVACLWQLHRQKSAHEVMNAIRRSASHFDSPNDSIGYGIPDFWRAHLLLGGDDLTALQAPQFFNVYPVPFTDYLNIELYAGEENTIDLELWDVLGRTVLSRTLQVEPRVYQQVRMEDARLSLLPNGSYTMHAIIGGRAEITQRLVKAP